MSLEGKISALRSMNINSMIRQILSVGYVNEAIILANQQQLGKGEDYTGEKLRTYNSVGGDVYSRVTIGLKEMKGQPTDMVTLFDTGTFYATFAVVPFANQFMITANFDKDDGSISDNLDTNRVLGLSDENTDRITRAVILPLLMHNIRGLLQR